MMTLSEVISVVAGDLRASDDELMIFFAPGMKSEEAGKSRVFVIPNADRRLSYVLLLSR